MGRSSSLLLDCMQQTPLPSGTGAQAPVQMHLTSKAPVQMHLTSNFRNITAVYS